MQFVKLGFSLYSFNKLFNFSCALLQKYYFNWRFIQRKGGGFVYIDEYTKYT